jgi:molybdopterin molybdotransferase
MKMRTSLQSVTAWIDDAFHALDSKAISLELAAGRSLAADVAAQVSIPPVDCAAVDGFAVCAADSIGAGAYNPLDLAAITIAAGEPMPPATDAVVPLDQAETDPCGRIALVEAVAAGANVERCGSVAAAGMLLVAAGCLLAARHIGLLAAAGLNRVAVVRRPRIRLVIAGRARSGEPLDSNGPMLRASIERDGGLVEETELGQAFAGSADLVLIAGGTGTGAGDCSAAALAGTGSLEIHGVALVQGETAGCGHTRGGTPVLLLPGAPVACLVTYELFAGRAIRRLGGRDPELPYCRRRVTLMRKIVSPIGLTDICAVRRRGAGQIEPLPGYTEIGLMAAAAGGGFVIVPADSEGWPAGSAVDAYFYDRG